MTKKRWISLIVLLLLAMLSVMVFRKQIYISIIAKKLYGEKVSFLNIVPEKRELSNQIVVDGYALNSFGIKLKVPFKNVPEVSENETETIASTIDRLGFTVVINKPHPEPIRRHLSPLIDSNIIQNYDKVLKQIKSKYKSSFDFINSSFVSIPKKISLFSTVQESNIHLYKQATKYSHIIFDHTAERLYFFVTEHCKVFQVGDPELDGVIALWIFPNDDVEIEINIITRKGNLKQREIGNIITSIDYQGHSI